jgi:hypothetical protein
VEPPAEQVLAVRKRIVSLYPKTLEPYGLHEGKFHKEIIRTRLEYHLERLPKDSKPGAPYTVLGNDNKDILVDHRDFILDAASQRLELLSTLDCSTMSPEDLVVCGCVDPVRLFIKGEPHSNRKVSQSRWRLIMAVSAVDQLVERILSDAQNKTEIANWKTIPSAPGVGLSDDKALRELYERIKSQPGELAEADVTGWDWSVKQWELLLEGEMRADLCDATPWLRRIFLNREYCVANAVYLLPDGTLVDKTVPGVQCSGRYNTSSGNSRLRVLIALLCGADWAFAMGDDCLENYQPDALEKYEALGHPLKMYNKRDKEFEFCSLLFTPTVIHPVDGTKTLFNLIEQKEITPELLSQFQMEMRNHPRRHEFNDCVGRVKGGIAGKDI